MTRNELIKLLGHIQNTECFWNVDIMTFAEFFGTDAELARYVMLKAGQLPAKSQAYIVKCARHIAATRIAA